MLVGGLEEVLQKRGGATGSYLRCQAAGSRSGRRGLTRIDGQKRRKRGDRVEGRGPKATGKGRALGNKLPLFSGERNAKHRRREQGVRRLSSVAKVATTLWGPSTASLFVREEVSKGGLKWVRIASERSRSWGRNISSKRQSRAVKHKSIHCARGRRGFRGEEPETKRSGRGGAGASHTVISMNGAVKKSGETSPPKRDLGERRGSGHVV